jgi:signal transduction histidine kinase
MKPEGIRKVIAEQSLEGAIIYLSEQIEAGSADVGHELRTALYQLQGTVEVLEDRVAKLETPQTENPAVSSENGEK